MNVIFFSKIDNRKILSTMVVLQVYYLFIFSFEIISSYNLIKKSTFTKYEYIKILKIRLFCYQL